MKPLLIRGMWGLGDNIYSRPLIRAISQQWDVWLETPWPELYEDLPVRFVRAERRLRTQMRNVIRQPPGRWSNPPPGAHTVQLGYGHAELATMGILQAIERHLPWLRPPASLVMDLPELGPSPVRWGSLALIRPVTVRAEWRNTARNPRPEYIHQVAEWLSGEGFRPWWVADLAEAQEWLEAPLPRQVEGSLYGELGVREVLALLRDSAVVVGGVGWIVPAAMALRRPAIIILGGHGGHNAPEKIVDRRVGAPTLHFIRPAGYCTCNNMLHNCDKTIPDLRAQYRAWAGRRPSQEALPGGRRRA